MGWLCEQMLSGRFGFLDGFATKSCRLKKKTIFLQSNLNKFTSWIGHVFFCCFFFTSSNGSELPSIHHTTGPKD